MISHGSRSGATPASPPPTPPARRLASRLSRLALFCLGLALVAAAAAWVLLPARLDAPVTPPRPGREVGEFLRIRRGEGFGSVTETLIQQGWIEAAWPLRLEARRRGWDRQVKPGWYRWRAGESIRALLARLARGEIEEARVTIPEGWRLGRILEVLADSAWVPRDTLAALARDPGWRLQQSLPGPGLEGFLFPDTYRIPRGVEPGDLLGQLLRPGLDYWLDSLAVEAGRQGLSRLEVWTLASIVEAEAGVAGERPLIAAVFRNRLRLGMRLESDPTVLFALDRPPGRVLYADLEVDSPYNTYRRVGLPPGPICSPGRASLRAALFPDRTCDALFFVARGDGTHVFSRTLAEHNRARRVLRGRS